MNRLKKLVESMNGTLEENTQGRFASYSIESPAGKVWSASSTHQLVLEWLVGDSKYKKDSIQDALERVSLGVTECDDENCDYCNPN